MLEKNKVIIIIPSYNGQDYWPGLMPLLSQEKYHDFDLEIVVVDNNSSDDSVVYLRENYPEIKLIINEENTGFVGANNIGYQYAKKQGADFIYLLNQDTVIESGFLQPLYDFAKQNKFGSLQSKLKLWGKEDRINTIGNAIHFLGFGFGKKSGQIDDNKQKISEINYASGAGVFISMKALQDLGGLFDETMFMYLEDLDLGWALQLLDYDNYLIPDSVVYHKYEFNRSMKHLRWFERNRLWTMLKNYKIGTLILIFPAWLLMELGQFFFALLNKRFWQKIRSYSFLLSPPAWKILSKKRKYIQSKRQRSDRQIVYKFSGRILFQPLDSFLLKISNFIFGFYWLLIKNFIFW
jgi:GT2 family glycosyltransferase